MNKKTNGQKLFFLLIIAAICIGAFCMTGCNASCFGFDFGCNAEEGYSTAVMNSCDSCGSNNSCGAGAGGIVEDEHVSVGIRFFADAISTKGKANAVYGNATYYTSLEDCGGCNIVCGTYDNENAATISGVSVGDNGFDVTCCESTDFYFYRVIKSWILNIV